MNLSKQKLKLPTKTNVKLFIQLQSLPYYATSEKLMKHLFFNYFYYRQKFYIIKELEKVFNLRKFGFYAKINKVKRSLIY